MCSQQSFRKHEDMAPQYRVTPVERIAEMTQTRLAASEPLQRPFLAKTKKEIEGLKLTLRASSAASAREIEGLQTALKEANAKASQVDGVQVSLAASNDETRKACEEAKAKGEEVSGLQSAVWTHPELLPSKRTSEAQAKGLQIDGFKWSLTVSKDEARKACARKRTRKECKSMGSSGL